MSKSIWALVQGMGKAGEAAVNQLALQQPAKPKSGDCGQCKMLANMQKRVREVQKRTRQGRI